MFLFDNIYYNAVTIHSPQHAMTCHLRQQLYGEILSAQLGKNILPNPIFFYLDKCHRTCFCCIDLSVSTRDVSSVLFVYLGHMILSFTKNIVNKFIYIVNDDVDIELMCARKQLETTILRYHR